MKKNYGKHLEIVKTVFNFLSNGRKKIPNSYFKDQLKTLIKLRGMLTQYQIELQMLELGLMLQINLIGLKAMITG